MGTENPAGQAAINAAYVGSEDAAFAGGSYVIVQKYLHDIAGWNALSTEAQERIIGRAKLSDIELDVLGRGLGALAGAAVGATTGAVVAAEAQARPLVDIIGGAAPVITAIRTVLGRRQRSALLRLLSWIGLADGAKLAASGSYSHRIGQGSDNPPYVKGGRMLTT